MSLLIKNGKIYQNGSLVSKNIFIKDDKITKITSQELKSDNTIGRSVFSNSFFDILINIH